ncbi:hypothetical protein [Clostridium thermobutyricum]|uniref:hypothetical protein n=1 Tax=Clostridium thermobutyricum TaxID=29372 RepID=UPI001FA8FDCD|nr:hypothetical protein [Clostridium thermobutyricum]
MGLLKVKKEGAINEKNNYYRLSWKWKKYIFKKLHRETGIPLFHLDMIYWNADKTVVEKKCIYGKVRKYNS